MVSDGAPDVTGLHDLDEYVQGQLILAALTIVSFVLKPQGTFVAKIFRGRDISLLYAQLKLLFGEVLCTKPKSSRNSSIEAFVICRGFAPPEGFEPKLLRALLTGATEHYDLEHFSLTNRRLVPFLACGDLRGWDADRNYDLEEGKEILEPTQPPTQPAYREAIERVKRGSSHG